MDHSQKAADIFDKLARQYEARFMNVDHYHHSLDIFCTNVSKPGAMILELACGPGNVTKYLLEKRPDFSILGADLSPNMVALARSNNPTADFIVMDCRHIDQLTSTYDGVVCSFMLPYLSKDEALKLITDISQKLNKGGVFYLSTMEDDYSTSGIERSSSGDEVFMHYHEAGYLTRAIEDNGLTIIDLHRQGYAPTDGKKMTDLLIISKKI